MTLHILHWLVDGYGTDARITNLVNTREIWIVFAVNPDGAEFDIGGGRFHFWRKNRQPNANGTIGTDLNRNYGYRWGTGGRTSSNPLAITYKGPSGVVSAPETRAMRDFVASRVVDGQQQIRAAITFHEAGRLVMWPYGYTKTDVPSDMTGSDHSALVAIGRTMARSNGYHPEQASDLYISHGTTRDWLYGQYRIFSYTFEMSVVDYPKDTMIGPETSRNRNAVLYLIERAACPLRRARRRGPGRAVRRVRRRPRGRSRLDDEPGRDRHGARDGPLGPRQPGGDVVRRRGAPARRHVRPVGLALVTGAAGRLLGGRLRPRRRVHDPLGADRAAPGRRAGRSRSAGCSRTPRRRPRPTTCGRSSRTRAGRRRSVWERVGGPGAVAGTWGSAAISLDAWAGQEIRIRFEAADGGTDSTIEAGIDDVRVTRPTP